MEQKKYTTINSTNQYIKIKKFYEHLSDVKRKNIERLLRLKDDKNYKGTRITYQYIANQIGVNKSTVSREIKRGNFKVGHDASGPINKYRWDVGQRVANENSNRNNQRTKLNVNDIDLKRLAAIINRERISPEDAVDKFERHYNRQFPICIKTIYKYIRRKIIKINRGVLRRFSFSKPKKSPKQAKAIQKGDNISKRPLEAENRSIIGHWEGDTVYGTRGGSKECLLTLVDRRGRIAIAFKIPDRTSNSVVEKFNDIESKIGTNNFVKLFNTITFDNGLEFSKVDEIEASALDADARRIKTYFANAYHSWERGTNENTNGWLRHYLPKGTDFSSISEKKLMRAVNKINYGKRRILGGVSAIDFCKSEQPELISILEQLGISDPYLNIGSYLDLIV